MTTAHRVLVVDDSAINRRILTGSLAKVGYEVLEATDGIEAVEIARATHPDLILLDVAMPRRDGFEVCEILRADEGTAHTPIIFITAKSEPPDIERAFALGASDYVTKPFHMSEVKARVSVHLRLQTS
jgi:CheY-like chemotaxis protein